MLYLVEHVVCLVLKLNVFFCRVSSASSLDFFIGMKRRRTEETEVNEVANVLDTILLSSTALLPRDADVDLDSDR